MVVVEGGDALLPAGLDDLVASCTAADDHAPFGEHTLLMLHGQRQVPHARLACYADGALAGHAVLCEGLQAWYLELAVHPKHRGRGHGTLLVQAAQAHVASHGGGQVRSWAHTGGPAAGRLARGWSPSRTLQVLDRQLVAPLPAPAVPQGLVLRTLDTRSDADRDAWLALSNAAFAGHPENGGWDRTEVDWRMQAGWTSGGCFPVLQDTSGRLVAGVWTKLEDVRFGELYVVAVAPEHQARGLGRVVVAEALRLLARHGWDRAVLYVDADNAAGLALYAQAGFALHHVDRCHQLHVPAQPSQRPVRSGPLSPM